VPVLVTEQPGSRRGRSAFDSASEIEYEYWLKESDDLATLIAALSAEAPVTITDPVWGGTLVRGAIDWERLGTEHYRFSLNYVEPKKYDDQKPPDTGDYRISFDTTGGQVRITSSLETIAMYNSSGSATPDNKQTIGDTKSGDVEGVDIVVPAMRWTVSYTQPLATVSEAYIRTIEMLTGTTNDATFWGRPAGEVLFMGATGSMGIKADPTIDYSFVRMPNLTSQTIGDITGIDKKGHEYLWVWFESTEVDTGSEKRIASVPKKVYVERVYQSEDLSALAIGT